MSREAGEPVEVRFAGRRYRIERRPGVTGPDSVSEFWPGRGVVGSYRRWLGHRHSARLTWYAAVNPTGEPFSATEKSGDLPSRRAAITWLLTHAPTERDEG
ncbi:hypothetical protein ACU61A_27270 [Pseudonocardia sichuanensis]